MTDKILNIEGVCAPTPEQLRKHGTGKQAFVKIEMNGWWRDLAVFNPGLFLEDEEVRQTFMKHLENEMVNVIRRGLEGKAP